MSFRSFPPLTSAGTTYRLYESRTTGVRGILMETGEPLCSIHAVIATESDTHDWTHKDDGLPHTLEHAVFMGSELFPYKGILDKLANRSLARGTNAWTATDHTCYTMTSAGHEGCLNLCALAHLCAGETYSQQAIDWRVHVKSPDPEVAHLRRSHPVSDAHGRVLPHGDPPRDQRGRGQGRGVLRDAGPRERQWVTGDRLLTPRALIQLQHC